MAAWEAVAGMVAVGAITPGPNNLVVMRTAARGGLIGALPAVAGVVLGSVALLTTAVVGGRSLFEAVPHSRWVLALCGGVYLGWLGANLAFRAPLLPEAAAPAALPAGLLGLFGFQFVNPKGWVMTLTAVAASGGGMLHTFAQLAPVFTLIPAVCLVLWCSLGASLTHALRRPKVRTWFDRAMGGLLLASALLLLLET